MGMREEEVRGVADLPAMRDPQVELHVHSRGTVPEGFLRRMEFALSRHYGRAVEYLSFKLGEPLPQDSFEDLLSEMSMAGLGLKVAGSETARMDFYVVGLDAVARARQQEPPAVPKRRGPDVRMESSCVDGWQGFLDKIEDLRLRFSVHERTYPDGAVIEKPNRLLFRGQPREADALSTTLERHSQPSWNVGKYLSCASHYVAEIESFTGERWDVPGYPELEQELGTNQDSMRVHLPCYDYLVYLRHHGFPSPLLDWTESPYLAAYFAYINARPEIDCAVYCFTETLEGIKSGKGGDPAIRLFGPRVRTHKRHFAQKSWYTVATTWDEQEQKHYFCSHERVFEKGASRQDCLFKIVLPAAERGNVLDALDDFNINHFTLFQSTDALVRAMASREFDIGEHSQRLRRARIKTLPP